jgi:hypothetical protein
LVAAARKRTVDGYQAMPIILGVDVARFGDDRSVIFRRQGRKADIVAKFHGIDTQALGGRVQEAIDEQKPDAVVIDGDGIGGSVYDFLKARGYDRKTALVEFHGGAAASDPHKYFNKRTEVWGDLRDWLEGGQIPDEPQLEIDLTGPDYGYHPTKGCLMLERKEEMKARGVDSPDDGDALAYTFAVKVAPKRKEPAPEAYYGSDGWMA